jgi:hypothetical protein
LNDAGWEKVSYYPYDLVHCSDTTDEQ